MIHKLFFFFSYLKRPPWDTGISPPELIEFIEQHPPGRALDLGCGTATNVICLAQHGWQASGADFSHRAITIGRQKAKQIGVHIDLRVADLSRSLPFDQQFDLILDIGCLHSLPVTSRAGYFDNLFRLLAIGGVYLLYAFTRDDNQLPSIFPQEVELLSRKMMLIDRQDGRDTTAYRSSSWFTFQS